MAGLEPVVPSAKPSTTADKELASGEDAASVKLPKEIAAMRLLNGLASGDEVAAKGTEEEDDSARVKRKPAAASIKSKSGKSAKLASGEEDAEEGAEEEEEEEEEEPVTMKKPAAAKGTSKGGKKGRGKAKAKTGGKGKAAVARTVKKPAGHDGNSKPAPPVSHGAVMSLDEDAASGQLVAVPAAVPTTVYRDGMKARRFNNMLVNRCLPEEAMKLVDEAEELRKQGRWKITLVLEKKH